MLIPLLEDQVFISLLGLKIMLQFTPFSQQLQSLQKVPIVTFAVAYDDPIQMKVFVLFFHQALYIQQLDHLLVCPAQLRLNGITVNDTPLSSIQPNQRTASEHSIIDEHTGLHVPLELNGVISFFHCRTPTELEVQSEDNATHGMST